MIIRTEQQTDYNSVYQVVKSAFKTAEQSDGNEQDLVNALRQSNAFIPELSLVAEIKGEIVGHIMFTRLQIGEHTALALAPLSVKVLSPAWLSARRKLRHTALFRSSKQKLYGIQAL